MNWILSLINLEVLTFVAALAGVVVSICAYRYAKKSDKKRIENLIASKEAQLEALENSMSHGTIQASQIGTLLTQKAMLQAEIGQLKGAIGTGKG